MKSPAKIFYSYSRKDEHYRNELQKYLVTLKREGFISEWYDRDIDAGQEFDREIKNNLHNSDIILCLLSQDYLSSDYIFNVEMQIAKEKFDKNEAVVIPIILRICDWQRYFFEGLNALPEDAKPIKLWTDQDEAFMNVVEGIRKVLEGKRFVVPENDQKTYLVKFIVGSRTYTANNQEFISIATPYIKDNRIYLPFQPLVVSIGIDPRNIWWDEANDTITFMLDSKVFQLKVGSDVVLINGQVLKMDSPVEQVEREIMVPARYIVQTLGVNASFDAAGQTITIWT
jgi:hypothetical protein